MDDQKQQIIERLSKANNVLVTVSNNPSVDQLAACIGLTLTLNKLDKHATAVFSGQVPSTIEFLKPDETLEKNTDSLRDFIISLDKGKADKLRYKVEDRVVRIFITPYRTSITDQDLEFSQGDFNVDVVVAIGVQEQKDLDQAITAHGRILHDATVITLNNVAESQLGSLNWHSATTSSLSEMTAKLTGELGKNLLDEQVSTAFLTGIVAETDRFSNEKTSADTMSVSAELMAAGANQQLVASKLQEPLSVPQAAPLAEEMPTEAPKPSPEKLSEVQISDDGTLEIDHKKEAGAEKTDGGNEPKQADAEAGKESSDTDLPKPEDKPEAPELPAPPEEPKAPEAVGEGYANPRVAVTHDTMPATPAASPFTSAMVPEEKEAPLVSPLDLPPVDASQSTAVPTDLPTMDHAKGTLEELEKEVHSPHVNTIAPLPAAQDDGDSNDELDLTKLETPSGLDNKPDIDIDEARNAVEQAMTEGGSNTNLEPIAALNAQPLSGSLHAPELATEEPLSPLIQPNLDPVNPPAESQPMTMPLPPVPTAASSIPPQPPANSNSAPPVPPPIIPFQQ